MKVHILISGWDKGRSIWGCMRLGADRLYIVVPEQHAGKNIESWWNEKTRKAAEEVKEKFSKYFDIHFLPVVYEDYLDCFKKMIKTIKKEVEAGNEVFVNISSGSHVASSAAIFAASLCKCKAYYVIAKRYDDVLKDKDRYISYGGKTVVDVPLLPISYMSGIEIDMLKIIQKEGKVSVSDLARKARNLFTRPTRSKFNYYVRKLEDSGFLETKISSGRMDVKVTDSGRMIIEAFSNG